MTPPGFLVLTMLTVNEPNVKSHDTIKLRERFLQKVWQSCYLLSFSSPGTCYENEKAFGAIINLELWRLNHFVWWIHPTDTYYCPKEKPWIFCDQMTQKWRFTLGGNGGRWIFFFSQNNEDAEWLMEMMKWIQCMDGWLWYFTYLVSVFLHGSPQSGVRTHACQDLTQNSTKSMDH